jgi:alkanesulfonate monooxygenase SsuD/methylene tetrahydromethanopterin reductase-like flavin-dependent oxidoreductase (luciferase family)
MAEEVGFDSLWFGDHLLYRPEEGSSRGPWEAWSMLAAVAAVTERVEIGPLVAATSFHTPAMLAKKAATVDEISGGRLILGLGAGWNETEYRAFGFPFDKRVARFEEAFTIIRRLLAGENVDHRGLHYTVEDCEMLPSSLREGGPPLMVGSIGDRMLRITLPHVAAWNAWYEWFGNRPGGLAPLLEKVDAVCESVGRNPREIARTVAVLVAPTDPDDRLGWRWRGDAVPITGTAAEIAEELMAFGERGIHHLQLVLDPIDLASIERCGEILALLR